MKTSHRHGRSCLFLVRLSVKDSSAANEAEWQGKVQRVIDGESQQFSSLQGLVESLRAMLSSNERR